jgi:hypothetical protein
MNVGREFGRHSGPTIIDIFEFDVARFPGAIHEHLEAA